MANTKITADNITDGAITSAKLDTNISVGGTLTTTGEIVANGGIALGDSDKAKFGASDDLQIYHNGNSFIDEVGTGDLYIRGSNNIYFDDADSTHRYAQFISGGAVKLRYDNSAKFETTATGIDVNGTATMDGLQVSTSGNLVALLDSEFGGSTLQFRTGSGTLSAFIQSGVGGANLTFKTGGDVERCRIDPSGNLLVGTTSNSRGGRAVIEGTTGDTLRLNGGQDGYMGLYITSATSSYHIYCDNTGTAQFYLVRSNGNYYFEGSAISDRDLKENIASVPDGSLALINSLTPRTYNFKEEENFSTEIKTGFIAQEVAEVITEGRVATGTDGQKDMAVDTTGIVAHLVKAMQEQQTLIESLTTRLETLENA